MHEERTRQRGNECKEVACQANRGGLHSIGTNEEACLLEWRVMLLLLLLLGESVSMGAGWLHGPAA